MELRTYSKNSCSIFFFFNDTATTEIYTLSLHDALPISTKKTFLLFPLYFDPLNSGGRHPGSEEVISRCARIKVPLCSISFNPFCTLHFLWGFSEARRTHVH